MRESGRRGEVIRAALELIAEYGFHGVSMAMIAKTAGVGMGTIYRYFDCKDTLINELYKELEEKISSVLKEERPADGGPVKLRFFHIGTMLIKYFIAHPRHFSFIEQYHNSPYGASLRMNLILNQHEGGNMFMELFRDGVEQKVMKDLPIIMLCALSFGPWMSLTRDHIFSLIELDDTLIEQVVNAAWDGVRGREG